MNKISHFYRCIYKIITKQNKPQATKTDKFAIFSDQYILNHNSTIFKLHSMMVFLNKTDEDVILRYIITMYKFNSS